MRPNVNKLFYRRQARAIVRIEAATNEAKMVEDKEEVVKEEPNITGGPSKLQPQETPRKPPWGFPRIVA